MDPAGNEVMKHIAITESGPAVSAKDITDFESKLGFFLPLDYREFLLRNNGGKPSDECNRYFVPAEFHAYNLEYGSDASYLRVDWFYATVYPECDCYEIEENVLTYKSRIPFGLMPIAIDGCGNQVCLGVQGVALGKVYFWDHELELEDDTDNPFLVANSFEDFVDGLRGISK